MPKVTINDRQGLVQSSGSGLEISSSVNFGGSSILSGFKKSVSSLSSGATITAADSGKVFVLSQAGTARTVTLPSVETGLNFKFVLAATSTGNWSIVQASGAEDFVGHVVSADGGAGDTASGTDTFVRFVGGTAVIGDTVELDCDGTVWYIKGSMSVAGGIVFG
jgi:hypothetical protein